MLFLLFLGFIVIFLLFAVLSTFFVVNQQTVYIVERLGKFLKITNAGIHVRLPFGIDRIAAKIN